VNKRPPLVIQRCVIHPREMDCQASHQDCVVETFGYESPEVTFGDGTEPPTELRLRTYQSPRWSR
jgi:hypothetical protein